MLKTVIRWPPSPPSSAWRRPRPNTWLRGRVAVQRARDCGRPDRGMAGAHPEADAMLTGVADTGNRDAVPHLYDTHQDRWAELQPSPSRSRLADQLRWRQPARPTGISDLYQRNVVDDPARRAGSGLADRRGRRRGTRPGRRSSVEEQTMSCPLLGEPANWCSPNGIHCPLGYPPRDIDPEALLYSSARLEKRVAELEAASTLLRGSPQWGHAWNCPKVPD